MRSIRSIALVLIGAAGCYSDYQPSQTTPMFQPEPTYVEGPPGGAIDDGSAYDGPQGELDGITGEATAAAIEPSSDPQDPGYVMGTVDDAEISATLEPYGTWVEDDEYGRIWRPDATVVGVDFTPYESCGTWYWTDYGWTFSCDWEWGWLPFHYGNWGWFDDYWAWVPDYTWSPAWVEWRSGGGYTGWRPQGPRDHRRGGGSHVRDHRNGPIVRDHRGKRSGDADWRFVADRDFGGRRIRPTLTRNNAEGLRVTSVVGRPGVRATAPPIRVSHVMRDRLAVRDRMRGYDPVRTPNGRPSTRPGMNPTTRPGTTRPGYTRPAYTPYNPGTRPTYDRPTRPSYDRPARPSYDRPSSPSRPTYDPSTRPTYPTRPSHDRPSSPSRPTYDPSTRPTYPTRPSYDRPASPSRPTYDPSRPSSPSRPSYDRPSSPPSRPTYDRPSSPSRPSYDRPTPPPSRSWSPPSRSSSSPSRSSSSSPSRSWSSPRSSSSSSSGSSSRGSSSSSGSHDRGSSSSSSSSSRSSGGGGRRR